MEDEKIVQLFWDRDEKAIDESSEKYGAYCFRIAQNILESREDSEECVSDTWLRAWNCMPPKKPSVLSVFLGKLTRNLAFDRYRKLHRKKRGGYEMDLVLEEIGEIVSGTEGPEQALEVSELKECINSFLQGLKEKQRVLFIRRYWYGSGISEIAELLGMKENHVSVELGRIRHKLKEYLYERGYEV